jgi:hypothetical protein
MSINCCFVNYALLKFCFSNSFGLIKIILAFLGVFIYILWDFVKHQQVSINYCQS